MPVVNLKEEVIEFIFLIRPVPLLNILGLSLESFAFGGDAAFGGFLPILFFAELDVALLAKKGLEVIAGNDLLLVVVGGVGVAGKGIGMGLGCGLVYHGLG